MHIGSNFLLQHFYCSKEVVRTKYCNLKKFAKWLQLEYVYDRSSAYGKKISHAYETKRCNDIFFLPLHFLLGMKSEKENKSQRRTLSLQMRPEMSNIRRGLTVAWHCQKFSYWEMRKKTQVNKSLKAIYLKIWWNAKSAHRVWPCYNEGSYSPEGLEGFW